MDFRTLHPAGEFPWGRVIRDYEVGPYMIRAFHPRKTKGAIVLNELDETVTNYQGYIVGEDQGEAWETLDDALAGLIVRRALGANHSRINYHFVAGVRALANERP